MPNLSDPHSPLATVGVAGIFLILFAETGLLTAFFPVVRTVPNPLAGRFEQPVRGFAPWRVAGGLGRSLGVTIAGYGLGRGGGLSGNPPAPSTDDVVPPPTTRRPPETCR